MDCLRWLSEQDDWGIIITGYFNLGVPQAILQPKTDLSCPRNFKFLGLANQSYSLISVLTIGYFG